MKKLLFMLGLLLLAGCSDDKAAEETNAYQPSEDATQEERIELKVEETVDDMSDVSIDSVEINEDAGTGEGNIVLVKLSFDVQNTAKTAKGMIDMYSSEIGAVLADYAGINELTIFWEVPYLTDGNIVKYNMEPKDDGMAIVEKWFDPSIFE